MTKINQEEYEVLKGLDDKWKWIARDYLRNNVYIYDQKPKKHSFYWENEEMIFEQIDRSLFQFIEWEDLEPYNIAELIEEYESEETEMRYKVGDKVKVRENLGEFEEICGVSVHEDMAELEGREVIISEVSECADRYEINGNYWYWTDEMFEGLANDVEQNPIQPDEPDANPKQEHFLDTLEDGVYAVKDGRIERGNISTEYTNKEPEVLSQEWIENKKWQAFDPDGRTLYWAVSKTDLEDVIVPEQELPVLPQIVAEYLDFAKSNTTLMRVFELANTRNELEKWEKEYDWIEKNHELFARAWLDGFTVEKEQKYIVKLPSTVEHNDMWPIAVLSKASEGKLKVAKTSRQTNLALHDKYLLTEKEIKNYEPNYWPFAKTIEELEK